MKMRTAAFSVLVSMSVVSCSENGPPPEKVPTAILPDGIQGGAAAVEPRVVMSSPGLNTGTPEATVTPVTGMSVARPPQPARNEVVVPPKDAQWTIFCTVIGGPVHAERANATKTDLAIRTKGDGRSQWYAIHAETESTIYYGFYKEIERSTKDGARAQQDRNYLQSLSDTSGEHPLQQCYLIRVDSPEGEELPQWNLANIPQSPEHYWTLQVAAFTADKGRRQAAIDAVKQFRAANVDAYYYHGDSISSVCVGIWPYSAVREQTGGNTRGSAASIDPTEPLFVSDVPLSRLLSQPMTEDGRKMKVMTPRLDIVDESLLAATRRFPEHAINGYNIKRKMRDQLTGKEVEVLDRSILVLVPETKKAQFTGRSVSGPNTGWLNAVSDPNLQTTAEPQRPQPVLPGVGRLRSTGE